MNEFKIDNNRFKEIVNYVVSNNTRDIIGRLSEKIIHGTFKFYLSEDKFHEQKIGPYYADILIDNKIIEIQNGNFNKLRDKLEYYIKENMDITIVYPIISKKMLYWLNEDNTLSNGRLSSKKGSFYKVFPELYKIKQYLEYSRLHFLFVSFNADEYRLLNGYDNTKKKGSTRINIVPKEITDFLFINNISDYAYFCNAFGDATFTTKDYKKKYKTNVKEATLALNILCYLNVIEKCGKTGNAYLYKIKH